MQIKRWTVTLTKFSKRSDRRNITVNCIAPGLIETDMTSHLSDTVKQGYLDRIPFLKNLKTKRYWTNDFILCSDEASYITGNILY